MNLFKRGDKLLLKVVGGYREILISDIILKFDNKELTPITFDNNGKIKEEEQVSYVA